MKHKLSGGILAMLALLTATGCGSSTTTTTSDETTALSNTSTAVVDLFTLASDSMNLSITDNASPSVSGLVVKEATITPVTVNCPGTGSDVTVTGDVTADEDSDGGGSFDLEADLSGCLSLTGVLTAVGTYTDESDGSRIATTSDFSGSLTHTNGCTFVPAAGTSFVITIDSSDTVSAGSITGDATSTCGDDGDCTVTCTWSLVDITDRSAINAGCTAVCS